MSIFGTPNASPYVKDGVHNYVVNGKQDAVNPKHQGTKAAAHYKFEIDPGKTAMIRLRLRDKAPTAMGDAFKNFADIVQTRRTEADDFYQATTPKRVGEDEARVMRQALAGMLWSKQYFGFDGQMATGTWCGSDESECQTDSGCR
jgi:hypothetical protein